MNAPLAGWTVSLPETTGERCFCPMIVPGGSTNKDIEGSNDPIASWTVDR